MNAVLLYGIILLLVVVIAFQLIHIQQLKKKHKDFVVLLHNQLEVTQKTLKDKSEKAILANDLKTSLKISQEQLNTKFLDLQTSIFAAKYERKKE